MIKIIIMLDCNTCGQPFDRVTTSCNRDTMEWKSLSLDLEYESESRGWSFYRGAHYCDHCVSDVAVAGLAAAAQNPFSNVTPKRNQLLKEN